MKLIYILVGVIVVAVVGFMLYGNMASAPEPINEPVSTTTETANDLPLPVKANVMVTPIEHATMVLSMNDVVAYVDPVGGAEAFSGQPKANLVLVTDIHGDHLSTSTLASVVGETTTLIVPQAVKDLLPESLQSKAIVMKNGEVKTEQGLTITAIPMYNIPETDDSRHAKGRGNGYVVTVADSTIYIAGDTGPIPEMKALTNIDMAFIPMNLPYTMTVEEAAQAVVSFAPSKVYPYHYRQPDGFADVEKFKSLVTAGNPNIEVILLPWYKAQE